MLEFFYRLVLVAIGLCGYGFAALVFAMAEVEAHGLAWAAVVSTTVLIGLWTWMCAGFRG